MQMEIIMDKYKTSELGQGLKKVYREEIEIKDIIELTKKELDEIFNKKSKKIEEDIDTGLFGDKVGVCPLCGKDVTRNRYGYGCIGYKEGCTFRISGVICKRVISKSNAIKILKDFETSKIEGFISKNNKKFSAKLKLVDGKISFDFN